MPDLRHARIEASTSTSTSNIETVGSLVVT